MKSEKCDSKRFKCSNCSADFNLKTELFRHYMSHRSTNTDTIFTCNICTLNYTNKDDLESHLPIHKQSINTTYNCKKCNRKFVLKRQFEHHKIHCKAVASKENGCESGKSLSSLKIHHSSQDFLNTSDGVDITEDSAFNDDFEDHNFQLSVTQTSSGRAIKAKKFHDSDDSDSKHQKQIVASGSNTSESEKSPKRFKSSVSSSCLKIPGKEFKLLSPSDDDVTEHQNVASACNNSECENSPKVFDASISNNSLKLSGKELKILSPKLSKRIYEKYLEDGFISVSSFSQSQIESSQPANIENNSCNELLEKEQELSSCVNSENLTKNESKSTSINLSRKFTRGKTVSNSLNPIPRQKKANQTLPGNLNLTMAKQNTQSHGETVSNSLNSIPSQNKTKDTLPTNMNFSMAKQNAPSNVFDQNFFIRNKHLICAGKEVQELIVSSKSVADKLANSKQSKIQYQNIPYVCNKNNKPMLVKNLNFGDKKLQILNISNPPLFGNVLPCLSYASENAQTLNRNPILHSYLLNDSTRMVKVTPEFLQQLKKTAIGGRGSYNVQDGNTLAKQFKTPVEQSMNFVLVEKSTKTLLPQSILNINQDNVSSLTRPNVGVNVTSASSINTSLQKSNRKKVTAKHTEISVENSIKFVGKSTKTLSVPEPTVNTFPTSTSVSEHVASSSSKKSDENIVSATQNLKLQGLVTNQPGKIITRKRIEKRENILNKCLTKLRERDRKKEKKLKLKKKLKFLEKFFEKCHNRLCDDSCFEYLPPELSVDNNHPMVNTSSQTDFIAEVNETADDAEIDPYANMNAENQEKHAVKCTCNSKDCDWSQHTMEEDKLSFIELTDELTLKSTDLIPGSSGNVSTEIPDTNQTLVDNVSNEQDVIDKMLSINETIKKNLSVSHTNVPAALNAMQELEDLNLSTGMWKKSLIVLKTIKACKKYKNNEAVRQKAKCIYEIFKKFYLSQS